MRTTTIFAETHTSERANHVAYRLVVIIVSLTGASLWGCDCRIWSRVMVSVIRIRHSSGEARPTTSCGPLAWFVGPSAALSIDVHMRVLEYRMYRVQDCWVAPTTLRVRRAVIWYFVSCSCVLSVLCYGELCSEAVIISDFWSIAS